MNKLIKQSYSTLLLGVLILLFSQCTENEKYKYTFQNPDLAIEKRVDDLVSRLTLDEKIAQMMNNAPAIDRLEIPAYGWWNEGLHGVARAGVATVFPQPIGMAASFDDSLLFETANAISDEFRAKYNDAIKNNDHSQYKGLTVWSPNINIFRDPRWGRGQETYGEDPWLTSRMGVAFVKGLQGNDPNYLKVIATPKHYVVHSGPESSRHIFDARIDNYDFNDTYLPAFKACVREANAYSVMGAYNCFRGKSCSGSDTLLTTILRDEWGFKGYVVSDCDAIADIFKTHKLVKTAAEAAAIGVKAGCDLNCGDTYTALKEAVEKGFITEKEIDVAVKRLFTARFKLGMFDPADRVGYNAIAMSVVDNAQNRNVSLKMAQASMVLLKNEKNLLPLKKDIKNIFVTGPNANNTDILNGNYFGLASKIVTPLEGIQNKLPHSKVAYSIGCPLIGDEVFDFIPDSLLKVNGQQGWKAEYFNNTTLMGKPTATSFEKRIDFKVEGGAINAALSFDSCSVRFSSELTAPASGEYTFFVNGMGQWSAAGYRFSIDGKPMIDTWNEKPTIEGKEFKTKFEKGKKYQVQVEYFKDRWSGEFRLKWAEPIDESRKSLELARKADVIVFFGGISPQLEGEEMPVPFDGFSGGDRTNMNLPAVQTKYLQQLQKIGKPIVLVLHNGSALAINWEAQNIPAILEAWYPGEEGGTAVADVLFGDYNPSGRLPITFYKSVEQLPAFDDYNMKNRTYRYFKGEPLYLFGYGLSYTTFTYSNLTTPKTIKTGEAVKISVDVENTGSMDGNEVVELFVRDMESSVQVPIRALMGFKRIHLKAGEKQTIEFMLNPAQLSVITPDLDHVVEPGMFEISVGGQQPDQSAIAEKRVLVERFETIGKNYVVEN